MSNNYETLLNNGVISELEYRALCGIHANEHTKIELRNASRCQLLASETQGISMNPDYLLQKMAERRASMATKLDALMAHRSTFSVKEGASAAGTTAIDALVADVMTNAFSALKAMANAQSPPPGVAPADHVIEAEFSVVGDTKKAGSL